MGPPKRTS